MSPESTSCCCNRADSNGVSVEQDATFEDPYCDFEHAVYATGSFKKTSWKQPEEPSGPPGER